MKPARLEHVLCNKRSHRNEKPVHRNKRKPVHGNEDPTQPKINKIIIKKELNCRGNKLTIKKKSLKKTKSASLPGTAKCSQDCFSVGNCLFFMHGQNPEGQVNALGANFDQWGM